jgi:ketosteroid isomerase-like protein
MSKENVDVARAGREAWNAGDMNAFRELHAPDVIVRTLEDWPEPGPHVGRESVMQFFGQIREAWDADTVEWTSDPVDIADRVVVRFTWQGTGHGPQSNMEMTAIHTVRKGRIRGYEYFWDHADALEAVGLSEQATHPDPA